MSQKNADRLESAAQETPEEGNTLAAVTAAAPETYTFSWQDEEDAREGLLLPCWVFYGNAVIRNGETISGIEGQKLSSSGCCILLAINAMDGTVVNPKKGF